MEATKPPCGVKYSKTSRVPQMDKQLKLSRTPRIACDDWRSAPKIIKTTASISDMNDFAAVNGVYAEMFGATKPARSCVQTVRLPKDVKLEIEAITVV